MISPTHRIVVDEPLLVPVGNTNDGRGSGARSAGTHTKGNRYPELGGEEGGRSLPVGRLASCLHAFAPRIQDNGFDEVDPSPCWCHHQHACAR
ncbi:MAG: hypothetical protein ACOYXT_22985 [Bacteroidota bacterium]